MGHIWPTRHWNDNDTVESWQLNEVTANLDLLMRPPACIGNQSDVTTTADGSAWVVMNWDTTVYDSDGMMDGGTRILINTPGVYYVRYRLAWPTPADINGTLGAGMTTAGQHIAFMAAVATNSGGNYSTGSPRTIAQDVQGYVIDSAVHQPPRTDIGWRNTCGVRVRLAAGDYVEAFAAHSGGGASSDNIPCGGISSKNASFSARWLSM